LKPGGIIVSTIQPPSEETATTHGVRTGFIASAPPIRETLTKVAEMVDNGELKVTVSTILPLAEIQKAHELIEAKHTHGKLVLQVVN
jgi:NADPH:quinone reductase-like Zn-dependent oxidoreductase